jgi:hypothetical protein
MLFIDIWGRSIQRKQAQPFLRSADTQYHMAIDKIGSSNNLGFVIDTLICYAEVLHEHECGSFLRLITYCRNVPVKWEKVNALKHSDEVWCLLLTFLNITPGESDLAHSTFFNFIGKFML